MILIVTFTETFVDEHNYFLNKLFDGISGLQSKRRSLPWRNEEIKFARVLCVRVHTCACSIRETLDRVSLLDRTILVDMSVSHVSRVSACACTRICVYVCMYVCVRVCVCVRARFCVCQTTRIVSLYTIWNKVHPVAATDMHGT